MGYKNSRLMKQTPRKGASERVLSQICCAPFATSNNNAGTTNNGSRPLNGYLWKPAAMSVNKMGIIKTASSRGQSFQYQRSPPERPAQPARKGRTPRDSGTCQKRRPETIQRRPPRTDGKAGS